MIRQGLGYLHGGCDHWQIQGSVGSFVGGLLCDVAGVQDDACTLHMHCMTKPVRSTSAVKYVVIANRHKLR